MAVYLISWQFTDGFRITKASIHPIPPSPRVHTPIITVLNRPELITLISVSLFSILLLYVYGFYIDISIRWMLKIMLGFDSFFLDKFIFNEKKEMGRKLFGHKLCPLSTTNKRSTSAQH